MRPAQRGHTIAHLTPMDLGLFWLDQVGQYSPLSFPTSLESL